MESCIFCKIIKGEIPSEKIYEDENILAFKDINPVAPIHVLVIPKKHIEKLVDVREEESYLVAEIFKAINKIAKDLKIDKDGFRVIANCGENGGQEAAGEDPRNRYRKAAERISCN